MSSFKDLFGGLGGDSKGVKESPRVTAALDRIAEASELSAAIAMHDFLKAAGSEPGRKRMGEVVQKLAARLARRHEGAR